MVKVHRLLLSWLVVCGLVILPSTAALAHKFKLFATVQGAEIVGYGYFSGGERAKAVPVLLLARGTAGAGAIAGPEHEIARTLSDDQGTFRFALPANGGEALFLRATIDGHRAEWPLSLAAAQSPRGEGTSDLSVLPGAAPLPGGEAIISVDQRAEIEAAVARQIAPLQAQLDQYENTVRFHDVLGGVGWLVGVCGLWAWWSSRRRGASKTKDPFF